MTKPIQKKAVQPSLEEQVDREKRRQALELRIDRTQSGRKWLDRIAEIGKPERRVQ